MVAFTYNPGSDGTGGYPQPGADPRVTLANPLAATGLVEFGGVRIHDGTFVLEGLGGITDTPEVRATLTDRAEDHGQFLSGSFYSSRTVTVEGFTITDHLDQLWPAMDLLRKAFALPPRATLATMTVRMPGWAGARILNVRPAGPLVVEQVTGSAARQPFRRWQAVVVAPDPRLLSATQRDVTAGLSPGGSVGLSLPNDGNFPAHFKWAIAGPAESPELIDDARGRAIRYAGPVPTGSTLVVDSHERTVLMNGGNVYRNITRFDDLTIPPGGASYRSTSLATNAGGTARVLYRDAWV